MAHYVPRRVRTEAFQFSRDTIAPGLFKLIQSRKVQFVVPFEGELDPYLVVKCPEGEVPAVYNDWVVRDFWGDLHVYSSTRFHQMYEAEP